MRHLICLSTAALLFGCGDDDESSLSRHEGIYAVESHTENPMACEGGDAVADGPKFFVIYVQSAPIVGEVLTADNCESEQACRETYQEVLDDDSDINAVFGTHRWSLDSSLKSESYSGAGGGDVCDGTLSQDTLIFEDDLFIVESKDAPSGEFARTDGFCDPEEAGVSFDDGACTRIERIVARRVAELSGTE